MASLNNKSTFDKEFMKSTADTFFLTRERRVEQDEFIDGVR